jgi:hypothetical protein
MQCSVRGAANPLLPRWLCWIQTIERRVYGQWRQRGASARAQPRKQVALRGPGSYDKEGRGRSYRGQARPPATELFTVCRSEKLSADIQEVIRTASVDRLRVLHDILQRHPVT